MKISVEELQKKIPLKAEYFDTIDSTSLYLIRRIKAKKTVPQLVIADSQSDGRGRVGKKFYSPGSTGLYLTFCFPQKDILCSDITPRIALAVTRAIFQTFGIECGLKWVNDVYLGNKKIAGVLCQCIDDYFLFGIGINILKPRSIPEELKDRLGYLLESCSETEYSDLIVSLYKNIVDIIRKDTKEVLVSYRKLCIHLGKEVQIEKDNILLSGVCLGIADDFSIVIEIDGKAYNFSSGYMTLKI